MVNHRGASIYVFTFSNASSTSFLPAVSIRHRYFPKRRRSLSSPSLPQPSSFFSGSPSKATSVSQGPPPPPPPGPST
ncbi:hypothetical protein K439DRAFT_211013 [Ramaria rubella]|nr:hypothetical protein K439DRAFT_211013 [Ramaria rubella]